MGARTRTALLALSVGTVLADSSVVTIALPEILARYDVEIATLAWALTSFNLALALAAMPAAFIARRRPSAVFGLGLVAFAAASLICAFAPTFAVLVVARSVQGVAGAAVVCAALDLLAQATARASLAMPADGSRWGNLPVPPDPFHRSAARTGAFAPGAARDPSAPTGRSGSVETQAAREASAARVWALAGIVGAALGPAAGGILTQLLGWESIFIVQAPVALLALLALVGARAEAVLQSIERPHVGANVALLLVSGALVAALFLLVILLINGWRLDPLAAGIVVTVMPLAAIAGARFGRTIAPLWARAAAGVILISGGLAALGWLPEAGAAWTIPPQLAVGAGLGLALSALTERALAGRSPQVVHGGWTIAARHAGVVFGLLLLTPIFTADLERNEDDALAAGTSAVLDSRISPLDKLALARDVLVAVDESKEEARIPEVEDVVGESDDPARADLISTLQEQLDRAVTNAFSSSFLAAALLGLLALVPILLGRRDVRL